MKKALISKWSFLGLLLIAASAVTAAIIPSSRVKKISADGDGWLELISDNGWLLQRTCVSTISFGDCHETTSGILGFSETSLEIFTSLDPDADLDGNTTFD